ncbi:hypothetical protein V5F89_03235 [Pelagerythrobacter marensis]|uniref:DUF485 domain-containing protein n=1 Tax=Pelagerythrobacter marensis TaxID=543877 RepID=A0ABZ2D4G7_9SPHN
MRAIANCLREGQVRRMVPRSPLEDPDRAAFAWARYKRLMRAMVLVTLVVVVLALGYLYVTDSALSIHFYIATGLGVGVAMLLTAALMGLVFLSSGTGHDESVTDLMDEDEDRRF